MPKRNWERVGATAVDSGTLVVIDPGYVGVDPSDVDSRKPIAYDTLIGPYETEADWEPRELPLTPDAPTAATFVRLSNFGGDGLYPVFVTRNADGEVVAAMIRFDGLQP